MAFSANHELIVSYFYDTNNHRGTSLKNEICLNTGDKVWMSGSCYIGHEELNIQIPVIIEGMEQDKHLLNIESDGVKVKPLVTLKCNWGEYPDSEGESIPRIDLLPLDIIK